MASFLFLSTFIVGNVNKLFYKEATSKIFVRVWDYNTTPKWSQIVRIGGDSYNCYCKHRKCHICVRCHYSVQIKCTPDCRQNVWNLQLLRHLVAIRFDRSSYCPKTRHPQDQLVQTLIVFYNKKMPLFAMILELM